MTTLTSTYHVTINASQEAVFAYVSDLTRHSEWSGGPLSIEAVEPGPVKVGSTYHSRGDIVGQKDRPNELRVTQYQPSTSFAFVANDPGFGDIIHVFTFKPQASGTLVERAVTATMPAVQALLFRAFIQPLVGNPMMHKSMTALKTAMEQRPVRES